MRIMRMELILFVRNSEFWNKRIRWVRGGKAGEGGENIFLSLSLFSVSC
jgi:hypothetical protein